MNAPTTTARKRPAKRAILSVKIKCMTDDDPDLSFMGSYSNRAETRFAIERTNARGGSYRYFNASSNYVGTDGEPCDGLTDEQVREYVAQDYERMERYGDHWQMIGVRADAEVTFTREQGCGVVQEVTSGGVWGVESDSDYWKEVATEQLSELRDQLLASGFTKRQIDRAFASVEYPS